MALMSAAISFVAVRECSANLRTSSATTANPRPASPARAASMAALRASKFVCSVMSLMTLMISEISSDRSPSDLIFLAVACTEDRMRCIPSSVSRTARLPGAGVHLIGGGENFIGVGGNIHGCPTYPLDNRREIVEHEVNRIRDIPEGVVGDFSAQRQVAPGNLIDQVEEIRDAPLQRILGFLISIGFRDPRGRPIQIFRNHAELIIHGHFRLGALISSRELLGKSRQSANGTKHAARQG